MASEEEAVMKAKDQAREAILTENSFLKLMGDDAKLVGDLARVLRLVNEQLAANFEIAYENITRLISAERNKQIGKDKAYKAVDLHYATLAGARNLIQDLIDKEQKDAEKHIRKGNDLWGGGTKPENFPNALQEYLKAQNIYQEIEGKRQIQRMFY